MLIRAHALESLIPGTNTIASFPHHAKHTIFIYNADLQALLVPAHVPDNALVPVVDHLLKPESLVQHPHHNQSVLVTGRQLMVGLIPRHHLDVT